MVDNAIVVVEAVHAKMEHSKISPIKATEQAMKEIRGAIVAITLVMAAVFIPVAFMGGPSGIFYKQFSLTMAISIVLSGVVALTLTPALCALILKNNPCAKRKKNLLNRLLNGFNNWYHNIEERYRKLLGNIVHRRVVTFGVLFLFCIGSGLLSIFLPSGFIPNEDQGTFYASVIAPQGATLERTQKVVDDVQKAAANIEDIESVSTLAGTNILSDGTGAIYGTALINLKPWSQRNVSVNDVIKVLEQKTAHIKDANIEFFPPPAVPGYGNASGFEMVVLDKTGSGDQKRMEGVVNQFIADLKQQPEIAGAYSFFNASFPQYLLRIDMDKAAQKGVTVSNAMGSLQTLLGSEYASNFVCFGQMYKVMVQALPQYRALPEDLLKLYVKNNKGEPVPISAFMTVEKDYGVDQIDRYNLYLCAQMNGEGKNGVSSGTVLKTIQKVAKEKLPRGYDIDWLGISKDEASAGNEAIIIFIVCMLFVYLLLAAQYESLLLPMPVIFSLPTGVFGAFFMLTTLGLENNIYAQVAMLMLIGLLGKNAILIVEFAAQKHSQGMTALQAAIEGAKIRLRPILMTSFAFIAGLLPLVVATGAGAVGNRTIGTAAVGGMLFGTLFGVIIIPGLYLVFATFSEKFSRGRKDEKPVTETI